MATTYCGDMAPLRPSLAKNDEKRYFLQVLTTATAANYILNLAAHGRHHFTTEEAATALRTSVPTARAALRRLKAKGAIADPFRGFHVIVPPEYRRLACLPAEQFVPQLLQYLGEPYYVALLSAAEIHGAAHQRPQAFQVITKRNRRKITCGAVRVEFHARKDMLKTTVVERRTPRGLLRVASPEATALELIGYAEQCGGLDNVASVLTELADTLDADVLQAECKRSPIAWVQRLGYILDMIGQGSIADCLAPEVSKRAKEVAPLVRAASRSGAPRAARWKLAVNAIVEPDL
jgi:predicted transcriptional regulator of viral defense system